MLSCFSKIKKFEMATLKECSIGVFQKSDCHRTEYGHNKSLMKLADIDSDEQELLLWRSDLRVEIIDLNTMSVCSYHREYYSSSKYERNQRCCDPFLNHANIEGMTRKKKKVPKKGECITFFYTKNAWK